MLGWLVDTIIVLLVIITYYRTIRIKKDMGELQKKLTDVIEVVTKNLIQINNPEVKS